MDGTLSEVGGVVLRWLHVLCGIAWVGYAYFVVITWTPVNLGLKAETRAEVAPALMMRMVPFFRAVAALTWLTGLALLWLVYWSGGLMVSATGGSTGLAIGVGLVALLFSFFAYDGVYRSPLGAMGPAAGAVCVALFTGLSWGLSQVMPGRAVFIHLGGTLGTIMLMNAGMRLAPAQLKMIAMLKGEQPFDPKVGAFVAQRATHNVVMSVAAVAYMLSFHLPSAYGHELAWAIGPGIGLLCLVIAGGLLGALAPPPAPPPAPAGK